MTSPGRPKPVTDLRCEHCNALVDVLEPGFMTSPPIIAHCPNQGLNCPFASAGRACIEEKDKIMTLVTQAAALAPAIREARDDARQLAITAVRRLEHALTQALDGEPLRGLANLGVARHPFYAARIRSTDVDQRLPLEAGKWTACVNPHGLLVLAQFVWGEEETVTGMKAVPMLDEDFQAEDVEALLKCLAEVLPRHVAASGSAAAKFQRLGKLAARVIGLLTEELS